MSLVEGALGEAVGKIYVERHFPPAAKARIDALVANLLEAYRRSITDLAWMGADTKQEALKKLAAFRPKIAYPEHWRDYSSLEISRDDLVGNVIAANRFELNRSIAKVGKPVDPDEWFMTPADGQCLLPPAAQRDRLPPPRSCSRPSSMPRPTTRSTTAASAR